MIVMDFITGRNYRKSKEENYNMFLNIENKKLVVKYYDEYISLPEQIQSKIDYKWNIISYSLASTWWEY